MSVDLPTAAASAAASAAPRAAGAACSADGEDEKHQGCKRQKSRRAYEHKARGGEDLTVERSELASLKSREIDRIAQHYTLPCAARVLEILEMPCL